MTKTRSFDILLGLTCLGLLATYLYDNYKLPTKINMSSRPVVTRANDILRYKTKIPENLLNITATSSACTLFLRNSAEQSMNDYANEFIDHHVNGILKTCTGAFPTLLEKRIEQALLKCKTSTRDNITPECYSALIETKTSSVATVIKSDANPSELAASILIHLVADKFATGDLLEHPERSLSLIDTLLEKEPNYLGAYKAKLLLLSMSSLNKEKHYKLMFQETLNEAKKLDPDDPEVKEIAIAERKNLFRQSSKENSLNLTVGFSLNDL